MFNSENVMISPGIGVLINGVGLSIDAKVIDGIKTRWQKNETFGNFVIEKLNPFGDRAFKLLGYRESDSAIIYIHSCLDNFLSQNILPIFLNGLKTLGTTSVSFH